ncbi:MAG: C1 family peptidase [Corynebacterium provencense]|jgi:bleomycin hydrolase|uniref:aminopeptidase C n=1 Tax=Corynebacterium provencense TaxID=1737425 RepID=UPI00298A0308|nr:C1 family peptidase [Corynebacterium provencense]
MTVTTDATGSRSTTDAGDTGDSGDKESSVTVTDTAGTTGTVTTGPAGISPEFLDGLNSSVEADPAWRTARNAATATDISKITLDRSILASTDPTTSVKVDTWSVTDQMRSGRCWIFAGLNSLRGNIIADTGVKDLELSQAWLHYWDKLEKANYFFTAMVELADRPTDDRTVQHLLDHPAEDGGQWNMFVALVEKYGVVPKYAMPETWSSSHTAKMNRDIATATRTGALRIRETVNTGAGDAEVSRVHREALGSVHRILTAHLGVPPEEFVWQYRDSDGEFHREGTVTPLQFARRYLPDDLGEYVCLVNDPRDSSPYGELFTVDYLGNVVGADPVTYLNVPPEVLRTVAVDALGDGRPVWFGCDTAAQCDRERGVWDARLHDYTGFYGVELGTDAMDKQQRLLTGESLMTHAMVFTGVDLDETGNPVKWRVENSWGSKNADKGFWTMNDSWFGEYVFALAVHRDRLPEEYRSVLDSGTDGAPAPHVLPAWDPMGALAD